MRSVEIYGLTLFMLTVFLLSFAHNALATPREYELKAAYLYRYSKFIDWSATPFADSNQPFSFCILGKNPFKQIFEKIVANKKVHNRIAQVSYLEGMAAAKECQVLFISGSEQQNITEITTLLTGKPILTVSDVSGFVRQGGMIEFYSHRNRVRFFIDPDAIRATGLAINAHLLRVADIVRSQ